MRLAVGLEGIDDILADLERGFAAAKSLSGADADGPSAVADYDEPDVTLSDERTVTLPAEGEIGVVDIGPLTCERRRDRRRLDRGAALG